jgi:hypothetical protein
LAGALAKNKSCCCSTLVKLLLVCALALAACSAAPGQSHVALEAAVDPAAPLSPPREASVGPDNADATARAQCFVEPAPRDPESHLAACKESAALADRAACRFSVAKEYRAANRLERAAPIFLSVAHDPTALDAAEAARLGLESVNMLGTQGEPVKPGCFDVLAAEIPLLLGKFCRPTPASGAERLCILMHVADVDITRCSECVPSTVTGRSPSAAYRAAAEISLSLSRADGAASYEDACEAARLFLRARDQEGGSRAKEEDLRLAGLAQELAERSTSPGACRRTSAR